MAYTWITTGVDTITSDVMQDNFTALFDGAVQPRTAVTIGGAMTATHDAFKMGDSTNSWNKLYCKNINVDNTVNARETLWQEQFYVMISATTFALKVTEPAGEDPSEYLINIYSQLQTTTSIQSIEMQFNSLTGYGNQLLIHEELASGPVTATSQEVAGNNTMSLSITRNASVNSKFKQYSQTHVFTESGFFRLAMSKFGSWDDTNSQVISLGTNVCSFGDISTVITSFNFDGQFETGTIFEIQMRV